MAIVPITGKLASAALSPLLRAARRQWGRRGGGSAPDLASVDRELDEALDTLTGDAPTPTRAALQQLKAMASGRSDIFADEEVREWLRHDGLRAILKTAVIDLVRDRPVDAARAEAEALYARSSADAAWWGGVLFDEAVAFLARTLDTELTAEGRLILDVGKAEHEEMLRALSDTEARLAAQIAARADDPAVASLPRAVAGEHLRRSVERESRTRAIADKEQLGRVTDLAGQALTGALAGAPAADRIALFRLAALLLGRDGRTDQAARWIAEAERLGANDLGPDRARLANFRGKWDEALALLAGRTDPVSLSLTIETVQRRDGAAAAIAYAAAHVAPDSLTGFMRAALAAWIADEQGWEPAYRALAGATDAQIEENPLLLFTRARIAIALLGPEADRADMLDNTVKLVNPGALRDDVDGARYRESALADLARLEILLAPLGVSGFQEVLDANRLYLQLGSADPATREVGQADLRDRLAEPAGALRHLWLAKAFDIAFDDQPIIAELDKARLLSGWTREQLSAAFQLALRDNDGERLLTFLDEHRAALAAADEAELAAAVEIEILAKTGKVAEAKRRLAEAGDQIAPQARAQLDIFVAEQEGADSIGRRLAAYEASGDDATLDLLVDALRRARDDRTGHFAAQLWRRRHRTEDALLACGAMHDHGQDDALAAFLDELGPLVEATPALLEHRGWALYRSGAIVEASRLIQPLRAAEPDRASLRQLDINLALEQGDWDRLTPMFREDLDRQGARDARQLMQAAHLARAVNDGTSEALVRASLAKAPDDSLHLVQAYQLAVRSGTEARAEAGGWLQRAIALSNEESGPLYRADLRDFLRMRHEDQDRFRHIDRLLLEGRLPVSMAMRPLGMTLSELMLGRLNDNITRRDARGRLCLPVIAGNRMASDASGLPRAAFDVGSLLLFALCGLLEPALTAFETVVIAPGTLPQLFHDLQQIRRIQLSRIAQAERLKILFDSGRVRLFDEVEDDPDDDAAHHAEAVRLDGQFVHQRPLYEPGSLLEQERDPAPFAQRLISPVAMVNALAARGEITADEVVRARAALHGFVEAWPDEPAVRLDRPLVIGPVALDALDDAGIIDVLLAQGAAIHVPRSAARFAEETIAAGREAARLADAIEGLRATLRTAISEGRIAIGRHFRGGRRPEGEDGADWMQDSQVAPLVALLEDAESFDVLVSADRVVNRIGRLTDRRGVNRPIITPVDVIDQLERGGRIDPAARRAARHRLREAGLAMIPLSVEEILDAAAESDFAVGPGRSLRAIAASIHLPLVRKAVQLPEDRHWLDSVILALAMAARRCWNDLPEAQAAAAASHLVGLMPSPLAYVAGDDSEAQGWAIGLLSGAHAMLGIASDLPAERVQAYFDWHEQVIGPRLDGRDRQMVAALHDRIRQAILSQGAIADADGAGTALTAADVRLALVGRLPPRLRAAVVDHPDMEAALDITPNILGFGDHEVALESFAAFLRATLAGDTLPLVDTDGVAIADRGTAQPDGAVTIETAQGRARIAEAGLLSDDAALRCGTLETLLENRTLAPAAMAAWRMTTAEGPLAADRLLALTEALKATPQAFAARVEAIDIDALSFEAMVERDPAYYRALIDPAPDQELAAALAAKVEGHCLDPDAAAAIVAMAPLKVAAGLEIETLGAGLDGPATAALARQLYEQGDPFSALAGVELAAARAGDPACNDAVTAFFTELLGDDRRLDAMAYDFSALALISLTVVDRHNVLEDWPLALRRAATLAHAGHAVRALRHLAIDRTSFFDAVVAWAAPRSSFDSALDLADAPVWQREMLRPDIMRGYLYRRLGLILADIAPEHVQPRWIEDFAAVVDGYQAQGLGPAIGLPGPLDEFFETDPVAREAADAMAPMLETADADRLEAVLFTLLMSASPPMDLDAFMTALTDALRRVEAKRWHHVRIALRLASLWRLPALAEAVIALAFDASLPRPRPRVFVELILVAVSAANPDAQRETLDRHLAHLVGGGIEPAALPGVAVMLDGLANARPGWAAIVERYRSAALLSGHWPVDRAQARPGGTPADD